jgi:hypothetical protein
VEGVMQHPLKVINKHERGLDILLLNNIDFLGKSINSIRLFGLIRGDNNKLQIISDNKWTEEWIQAINLNLRKENIQFSSSNPKKNSQFVPSMSILSADGKKSKDFDNTRKIDQNTVSLKSSTNQSNNNNPKSSACNGCNGCSGCSSIFGGKENTPKNSISQYIIEKSVKFLGGHKLIPDPIAGNLLLSNDCVIFQDNQSRIIEIKLENIKQIEIVDDKYTPSLKRGLIMGILGGDTESQSFRPHKCVLKINYQTEKRVKDLEFNFTAVTWAGAVEDCQQFYSKLNSLLD